MKWSSVGLPAACLLGLQMLASGASAQGLHAHEHDHPDVVLEGSGLWDSWRTRRATGADPTRGTGSEATCTRVRPIEPLMPIDYAVGVGTWAKSWLYSATISDRASLVLP